MTDLQKFQKLFDDMGVKYNIYEEPQPIEEYDDAKVSLVVGNFGTILLFSTKEEYLGENSGGTKGSYNRRKTNSIKFLENSHGKDDKGRWVGDTENRECERKKL